MGAKPSKKESRIKRETTNFNENSSDSSSAALPNLPNDPVPPADPEKILFGIPIEIAAQRTDVNGLVPSPIRQCIAFLDMKGLKIVGIYRIPGAMRRIQYYINKYNSGQEVDLPDGEDVHTIVGILKAYLRELPDPLFTNAARQDFRDAGDIYDDSKRVQRIKQIVDSLPPSNRATLRSLVTHLATVAKYSDQNKMTPSNLTFSLCPELGTVFTCMIESPNIIFPQEGD
eukprot:TRINITY_DN9449_c0_g1_i1.p1 TRINITY_DN9449_c0_g1~~TRINITY_DN9449_c0_g1_i1.p1  ORF type:complete len:229 (-),score=32.46 TRINITY_DN9449_c0_g1_i1:141-827(-)